jgi:hypothetical protein
MDRTEAADLTRAYALAGRPKDALNLYERLKNSAGDRLRKTSQYAQQARVHRMGGHSGLYGAGAG